MTVDRGEVVARLNQLLWLFGVANDADDHRCGQEGAELRVRAAAGIREMLEAHPFVAELLPNLEEELRSGHIERFGWSNLVDALERETGCDGWNPS